MTDQLNSDIQTPAPTVPKPPSIDDEKKPEEEVATTPPTIPHEGNVAEAAKVKDNSWPAETVQSILKAFTNTARKRAFQILDALKNGGYELTNNVDDVELIYNESNGAISSSLVTLLNWVVLPVDKGEPEEERPPDLSMFLKTLKKLKISKTVYAKGKLAMADKILHSMLIQQKEKVEQEHTSIKKSRDGDDVGWRTLYK